MSAPVIYLHIGAAKTGSSALQKFLHFNRDRLLESGILYPQFGENYEVLHHLFLRPFCTPSESDGIWSINPRNKLTSFREIKDAFIREVEAVSPRKIIISSEIFFIHQVFFQDRVTRPNLAEVAKEYFDGFQVKIVVYLRRQDEWLESCYGEAVKGAHSAFKGEPRDYILYADPELMDYEKQLSPWKDAFGRESIIVRPYEKGQMPDGVVADYFTVIEEDLSDRYIFPKESIVNVSYDRDSLEFIRLLNEVNSELDEGKKFTVPFSPEIIGLTSIPNRGRMLSPAEINSLVLNYEASNRQVAMEYLGRSQEGLFYEPPPVLDEKWQPYTGLDSRHLAVIVMGISADNTARINGIDNNLGGLSTRTEELDRKSNELGRLSDELNRLASQLGHRSDELGSRTANLEMSADSFSVEMSELRGKLSEVDRANQEFRQELINVYNSRSWKLTAPLRRLLSMFKRLGG